MSRLAILLLLVASVCLFASTGLRFLVYVCMKVPCDQVCHSNVGFGVVELILCLWLGYFYFGCHVLAAVLAAAKFGTKEKDETDEFALETNDATKKNSRTAKVRKWWSVFAARNYVRLSIARDLAVMMKALVSSVAIIYFILPSKAATCDKVEFALNFTYVTGALPIGPVHASTNTEDNTTCYRKVRNETMREPNGYQQLASTSVYHQVVC